MNKKQKRTGERVPLYPPADAVTPGAKPGFKAGNPLVDRVNEQLRQEDLIERIKDLHKLIKDNLPFIRQNIDEIIENKIKSEEEIERLLDQLLDYIRLGLGEEEFKRLNKYYSKINKRNSKEYDDFYKEIFDY